MTAQPGHKLRALQAGAMDFISKPFALLEVKTRIHNMLEVRLLYKALDRQNDELEASVWPSAKPNCGTARPGSAA